MNKMVYDPIACIMVPEITQDAGIKDPIQQRKREIVVKTENYLRSIGKSNSVGKFDRVVQGVKNLLYQGYLEGPELERAIKWEADRLIKKYNLDECPEGMTCDGSFKEGDTFKNKNGAVVKITGFATNGQIQYTVNGEAKGSTEGSLKNMLNANGYSKDERTVDSAIKMLDKRALGNDMTYSQVYEYFKNKYGNIKTKQSLSSSGQIITFLSGRKEVGYFSRTRESNLSPLPEKGSAYEY